MSVDSTSLALVSVPYHDAQEDESQRLASLPDDLLSHIYSFFDFQSGARAMAVCKGLKKDNLWETIVTTNVKTAFLHLGSIARSLFSLQKRGTQQTQEIERMKVGSEANALIIRSQSETIERLNAQVAAHQVNENEDSDWDDDDETPTPISQ